MKMITRDEILKGRDKQYPLSPQLEDNLQRLLVAVNKLRQLYSKPMCVSSGYRPGRYNVKAGGAHDSAHEVCEAIDIHDRDNAVKNWITDAILEECGLYMESSAYTPTWCHVQIRPTHSRVFIPY